MDSQLMREHRVENDPEVMERLRKAFMGNDADIRLPAGLPDDHVELSRAERRRRDKAQKKQVTYTLTADEIAAIRLEACEKAQKEAERQLKELREQMKNEAVEWSLQFFLAIPCLVLHDKFGFGQQRLHLFMIGVRSWLKACNEDPEALSEAVQAVRELGFDITIKE